MESRFYQAQGIDLERLANDMTGMFLTQGYQSQHFVARDQVMIQLKKGGELQALLGMQAALTVTMTRNPGGVLAVIGQQQWVDKAAAGAVGMLILWPLAFTAGAGAIRQSNLANSVWNTLDNLVRQQISNVQVSQAPDYMVAQAQQQMQQMQYQQQQLPPPMPQQYQQPGPQYQQPQQQQQIPPAPMPHYQPPVQPVPMPQYQPPQQIPPAPMPHYQPPAPPHQPQQPQQSSNAANIALRCPQCGTPYDKSDTFCSSCGHSFAPQKQTCASCGAELKPNATFCTKCGSPVNSAHSANTEERTVYVGHAATAGTTWGNLTFKDGSQVALDEQKITIGRSSQDKEHGGPDINLAGMPDANTVSRNHATIAFANDTYTLTDLNSANATRINNITLEPDTPTPFTDGDTLAFGKITCTFRKA